MIGAVLSTVSVSFSTGDHYAISHTKIQRSAEAAEEREKHTGRIEAKSASHQSYLKKQFCANKCQSYRFEPVLSKASSPPFTPVQVTLCIHGFHLLPKHESLSSTDLILSRALKQSAMQLILIFNTNHTWIASGATLNKTKHWAKQYIKSINTCLTALQLKHCSVTRIIYLMCCKEWKCFT